MDDEEVNEAPQALSDVRQSPRKAVTEEGLERPSPHGRTHHGGDAEMAEATPPPPHGDGRADGNGGGGGGGADSSSANSPLTPEQKRRMATNRERAMEIRKARKLRRIFLPSRMPTKQEIMRPLLRFNAEGTHLPENYGVRINENQSTKYYMEKRWVFSHEHFVSIRV